jgi:hypothetical protein
VTFDLSLVTNVIFSIHILEVIGTLIFLHKDCKNYFILLNWAFKYDVCSYSTCAIANITYLLNMGMYNLTTIQKRMFGVNIFFQIFCFIHFLTKINGVDNVIQAPYLFVCNKNIGEKIMTT